MDEDRILAALRAGPPDEPQYEPGRVQLRQRPTVVRGRTRSRMRPPRGLLFAAVLGVALTAGLLLVGGNRLYTSFVPPAPAPSHRPSTPPGAPVGTLARILADGTIRIAYPISYTHLDGSGRDQFDREIAEEVARRLGVGLDRVRSDDATIARGDSLDRFDVSIASTVIAPAERSSLDFTKPYYYQPAHVVIYDPTIDGLAGLRGKDACIDFRSYGNAWLRGQLAIDSATPVVAPPQNVELNELASQRSCTSVHNRFWTFTVTDLPQPKPGPTIKLVEPPVFTEQFAFALDTPADAALLERLNSIIDEMRTDGTIARISVGWLTADLSEPPP